MAKAQKEAIRKELLDRATGKGKEPKWEGEPTQLQLVKALNFYSATVEADQLQKYSIAWAKQNCPDKVPLIGAQPDWKFKTYGALMRIDSRGLKLPALHLDSIHEFLNGLEMPVEKETNTSTKSKRKNKIMTTSENANYRTFCDALDAATLAKDFVAPNMEVDTKHSVSSVIEACERELASMKDDPTIYPQHMSKWFRAVLKLMKPHAGAANDEHVVIKKAAKAANAAKEAAKPAPTVKATEKPKAAPKKTETKKPAAPKPAKPAKAKPAEAPEAANDSNSPLTGKSVAFLFDTRYGRLIRMVSSGKSGFSVKGKTISGFCEKKSKVALLKNFGDAMKPGASNDEQLNEWMGKCVKKGSPIAVGSRLSDAILVLHTA